jgi:hypothetical protein
VAAGRVAAPVVCGRSGAPAPPAVAQADVLLRNSEEALAEVGLDWPSANRSVRSRASGTGTATH